MFIRISFLLLGLVLAGPSFAQKRIALLIGNQSYAKEVGALRNPINDVKLISTSLRKIGFRQSDIRIVENGTRRDILAAVDAHAQALKAAGPDAVGFFYYSGHGAANRRNRRNYLIPVGVKRLDSTVWYDAIPLDTIVSTLAELSANAANFVIFDACRNLLNMPTKGGKGFVPVRSRRGMLIAFSTDPGETASDAGENSGPYAQVLASEIVKPGLHHLDLFQNVKEAVYRKTKAQVPWERNGLLNRVYLGGERAPSKPVIPAFSRKQADLVFWSSVKDTGDPTLLRTYLERYPQGIYASLASRLIAKLENQAEKETRAKVKQEELRLAEAQKRKAEIARREAAHRQALARQAEEIQRAKAEAKRAREALQLAEEKRLAAVAAVQKARREQELAERETKEAAKAQSNETQVARLALPPKPDEPSDEKDYVSAVQSRLKQLGCYMGRIDGKWGAGSNAALVRALGNKVAIQVPDTEILKRLSTVNKSRCSLERKATEKSAERSLVKKPNRNCISFSTCVNRCRASEGYHCGLYCSGGGSLAGNWGAVC